MNNSMLSLSTKTYFYRARGNISCLWVLLSIFVLRATAAPLTLEDFVSPTQMAIISILQTVFFAYVSHAVTVRPENTTKALPSIAKRALAIAWPVSGIHEAVGCIIKSFQGRKILQEMLAEDKGQKAKDTSMDDWLIDMKLKYFDTARIALLIERQELNDNLTLLKRRLQIFRGRVSQHEERLQAYKDRKSDELNGKDSSEYEKRLSTTSEYLRDDLEKLLDLRSANLRHSYYLIKREDLFGTRKAKFQADLDRTVKSKKIPSYNTSEIEQSIYDEKSENSGSQYSLDDNQAESYYSDSDELSTESYVSNDSSQIATEPSGSEYDSDNVESSVYSEEEDLQVYDPANDPELLHSTFAFDSNMADLQNTDFAVCSNWEEMQDQNKERYGDDDIYSSYTRNLYSISEENDIPDDISEELQSLLDKYEIQDKAQFNWKFNYDNSAYLDALLTKMGPERSKSVKDFIINDDIFIGMDKEDVELLKPSSYSLTSETNVTGPGAHLPYQVPVHPFLFRFLPPDMLDQLTGAGPLGGSSALGKIFTLIQLGYTVYEIIDGEGDSWSKLIMGIFMIMSISQTISLVALPPQDVSYSLKGNYITGSCYNYFRIQENEVLGIVKQFFSSKRHKTMGRSDFHSTSNTFCILALTGMSSKDLMGVIKRDDFDRKTLTHFPSGIWEYFVVFGGIAVPLLLGLIPGYGERSTTEWIVISWIVGSLPFIIFRIIYFDMFTTMKTSEMILLVIVGALPGIALVLTATVIGFVTV
ncbi:hypothetical protein J3Q64DRAFT_1747473 [Phycomyces blakesleeanus]|uniref:Uncharacterized protein n=1 Tax=Phycomyces blakesleeanus TaxID=4837 RepID=A0ABR3AWS5_PHYBL